MEQMCIKLASTLRYDLKQGLQAEDNQILGTPKPKRNQHNFQRRYTNQKDIPTISKSNASTNSTDATTSIRRTMENDSMHQM